MFVQEHRAQVKLAFIVHCTNNRKPLKVSKAKHYAMEASKNKGLEVWLSGGVLA